MRTVRSFVRRSGYFSQRQEQALQDLYQKYGIALEDLPSHPFFSAESELILEIGFGMGHSLLHLAKLFPEKKFIGIEVHRPGVGHVLAELELQNMPNVKVLNMDAVIALNKFHDQSFDQILIFFPDPWPKKRHHKRRLIQTDFGLVLQRKLKQHGLLYLVTDWDDYALQMQRTMGNIPGMTLHSETENEAILPRVLTKYEQRGLKLGHKISTLIYKKMV